jgi:hypothetical protein
MVRAMLFIGIGRKQIVTLIFLNGLETLAATLFPAETDRLYTRGRNSRYDSNVYEMYSCATQ